MALLVLWAIFLFGGFALGGADAGQRIPRWARLTSSCVLVLTAWSWFLVNRGTPLAFFAGLVAVGMSLGFLGDLFMAGVLPGGRSVLGGIAAFGLGHIFYITAIWHLGNRSGLNAPVPHLGAWGVWLFIGAVGWYWFVFRGQQAGTLHYAALPYALLLASTAGFATSLALRNMAFAPLALGAALFLLSDLILAAELFSGLTFPLIGDIIWLTYGPGQALIVYAIGTAQQVGKF